MVFPQCILHPICSFHEAYFISTVPSISSEHFPIRHLGTRRVLVQDFHCGVCMLVYLFMYIINVFSRQSSSKMPEVLYIFRDCAVLFSSNEKVYSMNHGE